MPWPGKSLGAGEGGQREESPPFSPRSGVMGKGGDRSGEKRLDIPNNLEKPWEWALLSAGVRGWAKEEEEEGMAGGKGSPDCLSKPQPRLTGM